MDIKKLLFVTKFEKLGFEALLSLLDLRKAALEHVVFLTVIERDKVAMRRGAGYLKEEEVKLRETANIRFIDWAEHLFEQGMEVGVYITVGSLEAEVVKAAGKEQADLIVIGHSRKGLLEQLYSGSQVMELLNRVAVPVLVYRHLSDNAKQADRPFRRPLLAIDGSPASLRALAVLTANARAIDAVDLVYVASEKELTGKSAMAIQKTRKDARRRLDELCGRLEEAGTQARGHVFIGNPTQEIEKAARECQASLIVLGSSTQAGWKERLVGSTASDVAEKSVFPTLIVPPARR
jgi:nucleotide-binding universal stress UspA family protein